MKEIYTIGFTKTTLEGFIWRLRAAKPAALIDVRLRPDSQLSGFAKKTDLKFILEEYERIEYFHEPSLAPSAELLDAYRRSKDWDAYVAGFSRLMVEQDMEKTLLSIAAARPSVVLLCSEHAPNRCHRRLLAERLAASSADMIVKHL